MKKIITFLILLLANHFAISQWSTNPAINDSICTDYYNQNQMQMISDGSGGAIIIWIDYRFQPAYAIFAQRINSSGINQWAAEGIQVSASSVNGVQPSIISDGSGGAYIGWVSGGDFGSLYMQHVNSVGAMQWNANGILICASSVSNQTIPQVTGDGSGGAIIVWGDYRTFIDDDLYAQKINATGQIQWAVNGIVISGDIGYQVAVQIKSDGSGGAVFTWQDSRTQTTTEIYAQKANGAGILQWPANGVIVNSVAGGSLYPKLTTDAGGAIICWVDRRDGNTDWNIYAQKLDNSGLVQWTANGEAICLAAGSQSLPQLVSDEAGGAIITWDVPTSTDNPTPDIYAQRVNAGGAVQWGTNGAAVCLAANAQRLPQLTSDGNGGAIITWQDARTNNIQDIYAQRINSNGSPLWTINGVAVSTATFVQRSPLILNDGINGMIISWTDLRNDLSGNRHDIYAQRLNSDGTLGSSALCAKATRLTAGNIISSSAKIKWNTVSGAAKYKLEYRIQGTTIWTAKKTSDTTYTITGLTGATTYECRVQTYCTPDGSSKSKFTKIKTFTTAAALLSSSRLHNAQNNLVKIYPNPANDFIIITYPGQKEIVTITIYDALGKLVKQETRRNELAFKLDVKLLKPGMYIIHLSDGSTIEKAKFVRE